MSDSLKASEMLNGREKRRTRKFEQIVKTKKGMLQRKPPPLTVHTLSISHIEKARKKNKFIKREGEMGVERKKDRVVKH